jgi:ABC-type branched-subunit amino acid transport system substrate-binding protein
LLVPYSKLEEYSVEVKNAIELAIGEINMGGGVLGKKLDLVAADDGAYKDLAVLYADSLVRKYKVSAIIGPAGSARVIHLARTYLPDHPVLVVSPSASSSEISDLEDDGLVWRTMPSDAQQTRIAADYIFNKLGKRSVGILYSQDAYGKGLRSGFKNYFQGKIVSEVSFSPLVDMNTFDFTEKMDELFKNKPEAIFFAAGGTDVGIISTKISGRHHVTKRYKPVFFGVDATKSNYLIESGNKKITEGMFGTDLKSSSSPEFRDKYYRMYNRYPVLSDSERAYDIVYILSLAMEKAKSDHYRDIKNELRSITEGGEKVGPQDYAEAREKLRMNKDLHYEGVSGKITFDENGDLSTGVFEIWKIENGEYRTIDSMPFGN